MELPIENNTMRQSVRSMRKMKEFDKYDNWEDPPFPDVVLKGVAHVTRNVKLIPGYKAVVDNDTGHTFAIVSDGYQLVPHQDVIQVFEKTINKFPEYGKPNRTIFFDKSGGRMRVKYTFGDVKFEIAPGDIVNPTLEGFASIDTTWKQTAIFGGFRVVCSNGMVIGKTLASYSKKHTYNLDLSHIEEIMQNGLSEYSLSIDLWKSFRERQALQYEILAFDELPFQKAEKEEITHKIKTMGKVLVWDDEEPKNIKVDINAWSIYNILTETSTHSVQDLRRQAIIDNGIARIFSRAA